MLDVGSLELVIVDEEVLHDTVQVLQLPGLPLELRLDRRRVFQHLRISEFSGLG